MPRVSSSSLLGCDGEYLSLLPLLSQVLHFSKCMTSFRNAIFISLYLLGEVYLAHFLIFYFFSTARLSLYAALDALTMTTLYTHPSKVRSTYSLCYFIRHCSAYSFISDPRRSGGITQNILDKFKIESCEKKTEGNCRFVLNIQSV